MSQKKVEQRKYEKANRKQIESKKRIKLRLAQAATIIVCAAICVFIGFSIFNSAKNMSSDVETTTVNIDAISTFQTDYVNTDED